MKVMRFTSILIAASWALALSPIANSSNPDLLVCLAYSQRAEQINCCKEFEISEANCNESNSAPSQSTEPDSDPYFYCKFRNVDGTGHDMAKWGKGTDFKFVPSRNVWEWRTEFTIQTIDANGSYYQKALQPIFQDQVGNCTPALKQVYEKKVKEIMSNHRQ